MQGVTPLKSRFFWKIYITYTLLFLVIIGMLGSIAYYQSRSSLKKELSRSLEHKTWLLVSLARETLSGRSILNPKSLESTAERIESRITIIRRDGIVIGDSHNDPSLMDNHRNRPEIISAQTTGRSLTHRFSDTMKETMYFMVLPVVDHERLLGYIRVSYPSRDMELELRKTSQAIVSIGLFGLIAVMLLGIVLARNVAEPIIELTHVCHEMMAGNYQSKAINIPTDEIGELGRTLNRLGDEITNRIETISNDRIQLRKLETIRTDFVANVSHELKTPLTAITGYAETLLEGDLSDTKISQRFLEKISLNAKRLSALVQDILSLAQLESPGHKPQLTPVSWQPIIEQTLNRYEDDILRKQLKLDTSRVPEQITYVIGDREAMIQILENLIGNAIRYTPDGGTVSVATTRESNKEILTITDTGIGIAKEDLNRIFERFYRVDKARSKQLGGTGLGLSIVKHMVSGMQGKLWVTSEVGMGSSFFVQLDITS